MNYVDILKDAVLEHGLLRWDLVLTIHSATTLMTSHNTEGCRAGTQVVALGSGANHKLCHHADDVTQH
jgi:hypothetical protein